MSRYTQPTRRAGTPSEPIRFPLESVRTQLEQIHLPSLSRRDAICQSADDVLNSLNTVSRRIDDLARELNCLGYFDNDDDDRPRAA